MYQVPASLDNIACNTLPCSFTRLGLPPQIRRDPRRPKAVVPHLGLNSGRRGAPADHRIGIGLGQGGTRELAGSPADCSEQRPLAVIGQASALYITRSRPIA